MRKVVCIIIPPKALHEADAIYETEWSLVPAKYFLHLLDDLCESMWDQFNLEIYHADRTSYLCMEGEERVLDYLIAGIYSFKANSEIIEIEDYTQNINENTIAVSADVRLTKPDIFPLQNYKVFAADSMAPTLNGMTVLPPNDRIVVQVLTKPVKDTIPLHFGLWLDRAAERFHRVFRARTYLKKDLATKAQKLIAEKCLMRLCKVNYRITAMCQRSEHESEKEAYRRLEKHIVRMADAIKTYNTMDENRFRLCSYSYGKKAIDLMQSRKLIAPYRLSTLELTTIWHPPNPNPGFSLTYVLSTKAQPPSVLPSQKSDPQIAFFGMTNFRDHHTPFGIKRFDRRRHFYALGKSGSGKSYLMQLLIKSDLENGFGCAVLDPHGDLVDDVLTMIPKNRVKDVVIFDPSDLLNPPCFNPLSAVRPELKNRVTIGFLDTFKRVFGSEWTDRMDHIVRYSTMALLNVPGSSIMSLKRLLSDEDYRAALLKKVSDESVRRFWEQEFISKKEEYQEGAVSALLNRIDRLLATDSIRNILGQPLNLFNFRELMDSRKIVLMKISKGVLGLENSTLLGSLLITKIYEAAMSRADIPQDDRQDFYFYIDEFQNFANESFAEILSESRKYRLCLTMANQYLAQIPSQIRQTVFGNVANVLTFRVGPDDAPILAQEFKPRFSETDLINLGVRDFYLKMTIDGKVQEAFSGKTLDLFHKKFAESHAQEAIDYSRSKYSVPKQQTMEQRLKALS